MEKEIEILRCNQYVNAECQKINEQRNSCFSTLMKAIFLPFFLLIISASVVERISVVYYQDIAPSEYTDKDGRLNGRIVDFWHLWSQKNKYSGGFC